MPITLFDNGSHKCIAFPDLVTCEGFKDGSEEGKSCDSVQANQFLIVNNEHAALLDPGGNLTYNRLFMRQMETYPRSVEDQMIEKYGEPMAQLMGRYDYLAKPAGKEDFQGFMRAVAYSRR